MPTECTTRTGLRSIIAIPYSPTLLVSRIAICEHTGPRTRAFKASMASRASVSHGSRASSRSLAPPHRPMSCCNTVSNPDVPLTARRSAEPKPFDIRRPGFVTLQRITGGPVSRIAFPDPQHESAPVEAADDLQPINTSSSWRANTGSPFRRWVTTTYRTPIWSRSMKTGMAIQGASSAATAAWERSAARAARCRSWKFIARRSYAPFPGGQTRSVTMPRSARKRIAECRSARTRAPL